MTQRNLQFLIMHLGPTVIRRETALSKLLPRPRFVKLNTAALLRMDDAMRANVFQARIASRTMTPNEARALENMPPLTEICHFPAPGGYDCTNTSGEPFSLE